MDPVTLKIRRGGADNKSTTSEGATPFHPFAAVAPRDLQASTTARSDGGWDGTWRLYSPDGRMQVDREACPVPMYEMILEISQHDNVAVLGGSDDRIIISPPIR